jgi:hypothetical protein
MSNPADTYLQATVKTASDLKTIAATPQIAELSRLTLPEIQSLTDQIAQVVPAGNVPGLILSGLVRIEGRQIPRQDAEKHLAMLFRGVQNLLDKALYATVFAGPAAVIIGYQKLLQLSGKDLDAAFPNGTWQFYLEFALREDSARHANETIGFQSRLAANHIRLRETDALAAWLMASAITLQQYDQLLENEWRERVSCRALQQAQSASVPEIDSAYAAWESQRPYTRGQDAGADPYPLYRRRKFDTFLQPLIAKLSLTEMRKYIAAVAIAERDALPAYLDQMRILARLEPGTFLEQRIPYALEDACLGVIYRGQYRLIPVIANGQFIDFETLRRTAAAILEEPRSVPTGDLDDVLVHTRRSAQGDVRSKADRAGTASIRALGFAPILLNWDLRAVHQPLAAIRQGQRGIGDHALTLFFTSESTVFDQSHIFFDGAWGAALAEIMSNEALSWALYFSQLPPAQPVSAPPPALTMSCPASLRAEAAQARISVEAAAETTTIRLGPILTLRRLFKTRNDLVNITVNDLLVLYRTIFGRRYTPSLMLRAQLDTLQASPDPVAQEAYALIKTSLDRLRGANPAILIPMDASHISPKERLFPTTFRNPMENLLEQHDYTCGALAQYKGATGDRTAIYATFDEAQRTYLRMLASFGILMRKHRDIALSGESMSTVSIKLLAHMPDVMRKLLNEIPGRFDSLNEVIKGEEVLSNVGRVAKGSTLRRFITAKDDNEQKTLAWGILTDDQDIVHLSLRDFRPHVTFLVTHGLTALANQIVQDFVDAYADGFNLFVRELRDITVASRETRSGHHKLDLKDETP